MTADPELANLARTAWQQYRDVEGESWRVTPGAPVLYFGDLPKFEASDVRIVTVGLNPSNQEFPVGAPFCRFTGVDTDDATQYLSALNAYFRQCPYTAWFDFYEQALLGAGASYYGESKNVALHTDIASVIPTDPTWSRLGQLNPESPRQDRHKALASTHRTFATGFRHSINRQAVAPPD